MKFIFGNDRWLQAAAFRLRYDVFVLEQGIDPKMEFDHLDDLEREYLVLFQDNLPLATLRYQTDFKTQLHPDRFCVQKAFRKQGLGKQSLLELERIGVSRGCTTSLLSAEIMVQSFYEHMGYHVCSDPYEEDGILCVAMKKFLTPYL